MHPVLVIRPAHIIADALQQKEGRSGAVFLLFLPCGGIGVTDPAQKYFPTLARQKRGQGWGTLSYLLEPVQKL